MEAESREPPAALDESVGPANLLIVSDLHLGGALRPPLDFGARRRVVTLDRELCRFLEYHAAHRRDGRPWTLVLNGDTLDFMHMNLRPPARLRRWKAEADEADCGLAFDEKRARWKLETIARYHRRTFEGLCRFLEAGNRCVFVVGNHDVELSFEAVRRDLVEHVARHAADPAAVRGRLAFTDWFYFEKGRAYIEHGHRFDPYATFPDPLVPFDVRRPSRIAPSFSHVALRFFANRIGTLPIHDLDTWSGRDFLRWALTRAGMSLPGLLLRFVAFVFRYARESMVDRFHRWRERARWAAARMARLRSVAGACGLPLEVLWGLDRLRHPPVGASLTRLAQAFYFDRLGLLAVLGAAVALGFAWVRDAGWKLAIGLAAFAMVLHLWRLLARLRPSPDCHPLLASLAREIVARTGARVVVFGHTHRPGGGELDADARRCARWLNPGSWEHLHRGRRHAPGEQCRCGLRYALVTGAGEALEARLMGWCRTRGTPHAPGGA